MATWKRTSNNFALDGTYTTSTSPLTVTSSPYCYYTDSLIEYTEGVPFSSTDPGTYTVTLTCIRQGGPSFSGDVAFEYSVVVTDIGNNEVRHEFFKKKGTPTNIDSITSTLVTTNIFAAGTKIPFIVAQLFLEPFLDNAGPTGQLQYNVARQKAAAGFYDTTLTTSEGVNKSVGTLEYRALVIDGIDWSETAINGNDEPPGSAILRGDIQALPASSSWVPDMPVFTRDERFFLGATTPFDTFDSQASHISGVWSKGNVTGVFRGVNASWNGTDQGEYVAGTIWQLRSEQAEIENGEFTFSQAGDFILVIPPEPCPPTEDEKRKRECSCDGVNNKGQLAYPNEIHMGGSSLLDTSVSLNYLSANSEKEPASFGYGWGMDREQRLFLSANQTKMIYTYGGGMFEVWDIVGGNYQPAFPHNFTTLVEESDTSFTMTFQDESVKKFHPLSSPQMGSLDWESDRNGNKLHYHYDGTRLEAMSDALAGTGDPDGRVTRFQYPSPTDRQPTAIIQERLDGSTVLAQRQTTLTYYSSTDSGQGHIIDRLATIQNPEGETTTYLYHANDQNYRFGKLYRVLDARGHISMEYDYHDEADVRVKSVTTYTDLGSGAVPEMRRDYTYGSNPETKTMVATDLTDLTTPTRTMVYTYNANQLPIQIDETVGAQTNTTLISYDEMGGNPYRVKQRTDPNMEVENFTYDIRGNTLTSQGKDGETTEMKYEILNKPDFVSEIILPQDVDINNLKEGRHLEFTYDGKMNVQKIKEVYTHEVTPTQTDTESREVNFKIRNGVDTTETDGQIWKIIDRRWDGVAPEDDYATIFSYYADGNLLSVETPASPGAPSTKLTFEYDDFDNLTKVTDLLGNEWTSDHDNLDRLIEQTDARGKKSYFDYQNGLMIAAHAPANLGPAGVQSRDVGQSRMGRASSFTHDYRGRVTKLERDKSSTTQEARVEYEFTGFGEMLKLHRLINGLVKTHEWKYDQLGRVVEMIDDLGRSMTRVYQPYCKDFTTTTARGLVTKNSFDVLCRPAMVEASSEDLEYTYDTRRRLISVSQKEKARYSDGSDPPKIARRFGTARYLESSETWTMEYDAFDRVEKMTYPGGEFVLYDYGLEDELISMTDADGKVTRYEYNQDLSLKRMTIERSGQADQHFDYTYDAAGRLTKLVYPGDMEVRFDDGATPTPNSGWNENGQLTHMRYLKTSNQSLIRSFQYAYDDSGNRTQMLESNGTASQDIEWQYRYDWLDRLVRVSRGVGGATPSVQREYVFDESDNRLYMDDFQNNQTFWYTYKTVGMAPDTKYSDELAEVLVATGTGKRAPADLADFASLETFVNDDDGNLTSRTIVGTGEVLEYSWNDFNRLLYVKSSLDGLKQSNLYDANGIREQKIDKNGNSALEFTSGIATTSSKASTGSTAPTISYISGPGGILGAEIDGQFVFHVTDALSTVRAVIDSSGSVIRSFEFDEYGNPIPGGTSGSGTASPKTWIGGLSVNDDTADSGMFNMGHRNYAAGVLGRFISRDPIGHSGGLNLYSYPTNPVNYVDPAGLEPVWWYDALGGQMVPDYSRPNVSTNDFNCFRHAVGEHIQGTNSYEDDANKRNRIVPNQTMPGYARWNSHPFNELRAHYDFLPLGSAYQVGDTAIFGRDNNNNQKIDWNLYPTGGGQYGFDVEHAAVVSEVNSKGEIVRCTSKAGEGSIRSHAPDAPWVEKNYGKIIGVFRLKPGARSGRLWSK